MAKIIYTSDLPDGIGGRCYYPYFPLFGTCTIKIKPKNIDDIGLLNHELKHVEQYKSNFWHIIKVVVDDEYIYKCELEAYEEQIKAYDYKTLMECEWIINALLNKYDLDIGIDTIKKDLIKILDKVNE